MFIMKCIADIQNSGSESMHSRNSHVDYEGVSMCHWNIGLIIINTLKPITNICKVRWNKLPCIRTVTLFNNRSSEWMKYFFPSGRYLIGLEAERRMTFVFLSYCTNKSSLNNCLWVPLKTSPMFFGEGGFSGRQT